MPKRTTRRTSPPTPVTSAIRAAIADRHAAGETTNSIAIAAGVPQPTLQRFLSGERPNLMLPTVDKLVAYLRLEVRPVDADADADAGESPPAGRKVTAASKPTKKHKRK